MRPNLDKHWSAITLIRKPVYTKYLTQSRRLRPYISMAIFIPLFYCLSNHFTSQWPYRLPPMRTMRPESDNIFIVLFTDATDTLVASASSSCVNAGFCVRQATILSSKVSPKVSSKVSLWYFGTLDWSVSALCNALKWRRMPFPSASYFGRSAPIELHSSQIFYIFWGKCLMATTATKLCICRANSGR